MSIVQLPYFLRVTETKPEPGLTACVHLNAHQKEDGQLPIILVGDSLLQNESINLNVEKEEQLPATKLAEVFASIPPYVLMQVCFIKKDKQERVLTGYRLTNEGNALGRSPVVDLEIEDGHNQRQVDHRSLQWVVYRNTKYVLKK